MKITINESSWLNLADLLEYNDYVFWDQTDFPEIPFAENDTYIQLNQLQANRLDLLAYDNYGDSNLMWVILLANNLDLPNQAREGMVIRIPARETIDQILKKTT